MVLLTGLSVAVQLSSASLNSDAANWLSSRSMPLAVVETKQGMYRDYTVERVDDSKLDANIKTYKTAEETDDSKTKYWAILGVLVAGSFVIPMVRIILLLIAKATFLIDIGIFFFKIYFCPGSILLVCC